MKKNLIAGILALMLVFTFASCDLFEEEVTPNGVQLKANEWVDENGLESNFLNPTITSRTYWFRVTSGTRYNVYLYDWDYDNNWVDAVATGRYFGDDDTTYITLQSYTTFNNIARTNVAFNRVDPKYEVPMSFTANKSGFAVITVERYMNTSPTVEGWFDLSYTVGNPNASIVAAPSVNARSVVSNPLAPSKPGRGINLQTTIINKD